MKSASAKSGSSTIQDDIPPVHVLEAAQHQDRKETEDLLAGFDRPGRGPKPVSKDRDFVDYYARKKGGAGGVVPSAPVAPVAIRVKQADVATVIKPRKREGMPPWLGWSATAALMLAVGGVVAYLATSETRTSGAPSGPSAATTITAATPPSQAARDNNIPPPSPADATPITTSAVTVVEPTPSMTGRPAVLGEAPPRASAKRDPRAAPSTTAGVNGSHAPTATATDDTKPPPRDDFIRDL